MTFGELVAQIINRKFGPIELRSCPDQYVGKISTFHSTQIDFSTRFPVAERPSGLKCLIMVMESPHIDEFLDEPCPAKGKTGKQIRTWIDKVNGLYEYRDYGLLIINAIQNQCSLGAPTKYFRDEVFDAVWSDGGESSFITRLSSIYRDGDVLVNCCTKGNSNKVELRQRVQHAICRANLGCDLLRRTHPSSWHTDKNRKYVWNIKT